MKRVPSDDDVVIRLRLRQQNLAALEIESTDDMDRIHLGRVGLLKQSDGTYAMWCIGSSQLPVSAS